MRRLRPLARVRDEDNAPFSAAHPKKIGGAIRWRVYAEASPLRESQVYRLAPLRPPLRVSPLAQGVRITPPFPQYTRSQVYRLAQLRLSAFSVQPARKGGRNTTAGVRGGFAPPGHSQVSSENLVARLRFAQPCSAKAATTWQPARARGRRWWR